MGGVQQGNIAKGSNGEATQSSEETQCVWRSIWGLVSALGLRETRADRQCVVGAGEFFKGRRASVPLRPTTPTGGQNVAVSIR